ncbi:MAG: glycosyltransferase family 2 protein [Candidatus Omnitrophica bacterium]|nr:glycosyltransferase family 2 protein [Candidatus Omnitrophota bacterium]
MRVCVLIPAHNEIRTISEVVTAVRAKGLDVLVVDDGSIDNSGDAAAKAGAVVIRNDQCKGKGFSLRQGFNVIVNRGYQGVITMDGDGQHAPEDLEKFLAKAELKECGIINGNRLNNAKGMPWLRYSVNCLMSWILSLVCKQNIQDSQCGYRYICCDVLKYFELNTDGFEIESELLIKAARKKIKIDSVSIKTIYGQEVSKVRPVRDTIKFITFLWKQLFPAKS